MARERTPLPPGFGAIWTTVAIDLIGFGIVLPILPRYAEDLSASPGVIGLVVASFSLAQMVGSPLIGRLSDRIGRKPVLILSLAGTAVGSLITGLAGTVWILLLGRIVDGLSGASVSVAQASVADVASPEERPRLLGLLGAAFGVGFVVGPAIGALAAFGGPHIPFFVASAIAGTNAIVALRRLPETHPRRQPAADVQLEGRVIPVVRSRAAGISRCASLAAKVAVWCEVSAVAPGPLLERLDALACDEPSDIAAGIRYATRRGAKIINLSLEFDTDVTAGDIPQILDAVAYARARGSRALFSLRKGGFEIVSNPSTG